VESFFEEIVTIVALVDNRVIFEVTFRSIAEIFVFLVVLCQLKRVYRWQL
jgi:hypothetical protein